VAADAPRLLALDTEDDSEGTCGIINFFDGREHTTFTGPALHVEAWAWLREQGPAHVWACNVEYDLINLCGPWLGKMVTLQYVSSGILRGSWRDAPARRPVTFFDTLRHWPASVKRMGEFLGLPKLPQDFQSVTYCRRDTEIVWRFVRAMLDRYEALGLAVKATLPSMALQLFRQMLGRPLPVVPEALREFFRLGYYGGRVEVYQFGPIAASTTYHYDVNSLYPSVMATGAYPDVWHPWRSRSTLDLGREGIAEVTMRVPECALPGLPVRADEELLYPWGRLRGVWPYPELRGAVEDGAVIEAVHRCVEYAALPASPFAEYVRYCYAQRRAATDPLGDLHWKLMLNSLYGKFGQRDGLEVIHQDRSRTLATRGSGHANVVWAAYVTSYARLALLGHLRACRVVYYTDTDSVFTPEHRPTSGDLGALKLEGVYDLCQFFGNKVYAVQGVDARGAVVDEAKAKGVPKDAARDFIRTGRAVYRKPARYRESRRSFAEANVWYDAEKRRDPLYTKRVILADGSTRAWEWGAYCRAVAEGSLDLQAKWGEVEP